MVRERAIASDEAIATRTDRDGELAEPTRASVVGNQWTAAALGPEHIGREAQKTGACAGFGRGAGVCAGPSAGAGH